MYASSNVLAKLALGKECRRWAMPGLLDQSFNPVTLSLRQADGYRSFHYVFNQQTASQVKCTGRQKRGSRVHLYSNQPALTSLPSDIQISGENVKRVSTVALIVEGEMRLCTS